ncbi:ABC-2 type transport system permease protein/lipopolysaccharide transport system permease protein [Friedmanniella endophytica]|uniref:Transport permease protein n=1 Tax=Microlunatus kandeliicorticis TaxID=1759536 RepID=A0A7W3IS48_9ACTN|nr:ABC transporter permease [Microlunatus kandeliicorticis]MBA8794243.1 ABC-2 type transport system permease protein/lipopolysaccharide transport system permease protein [Microlunatus kandeliicorticis]
MSRAEPATWRENAAGTRSAEASSRVLWQARELIGFLALRDLRVRYKQAGLGVIWVLLQPVATVVVFTLVFGRLARVGSDGLPYPLFAIAGMVTWTYFSAAVLRGSESLVSNPELVTKVAFPRLAAPAAALVPPLVDLAVSLPLVLVLALVYRVGPHWSLLAVPLWAAVTVLTAFGFAAWLAALNVRFRDVRQALGPLLQIWLFASPVAYPASLLSGWPALVYAVNPVVGVLGLGRWALLGAPWPGWPLLVSLSVATVVLASGLAYFRSAQRWFADVI